MFTSLWPASLQSAFVAFHVIDEKFGEDKSINFETYSNIQNTVKTLLSRPPIKRTLNRDVDTKKKLYLAKYSGQ